MNHIEIELLRLQADREAQRRAAATEPDQERETAQMQAGQPRSCRTASARGPAARPMAVLRTRDE
jgi:hypothetical protein